MAMSVDLLGDPSDVLDKAGDFLRRSPLQNNVILTLLHRRRSESTPGRYWIATVGSTITGVVFQSPLDFDATVTPMDESTCRGMVEAIAEAAVELPGVVGDAPTAARFAGHWTEVTKSGAAPRGGQRIYAWLRTGVVPRIEGQLAPATPDDVDRIAAWANEFSREAGAIKLDRDAVAQRVAGGEFWLWRTPEVVSMAASTPEVEGVARIYGVYTPPEWRQRGYAGACVGHLSRLLKSQGSSCMLYTDLGNPVSNSIYRRLGYEAISEVLRYRFSTGAPAH